MFRGVPVPLQGVRSAESRIAHDAHILLFHMFANDVSKEPAWIVTVVAALEFVKSVVTRAVGRARLLCGWHANAVFFFHMLYEGGDTFDGPTPLYRTGIVDGAA